MSWIEVSPLGRSGLNVLGAVTKALSHAQVKAILGCCGNNPIEAIAATGGEFNAEEANVYAWTKVLSEGITEEGLGCDAEVMLVGRGEEAWFAEEDGSPGLLVTIQTSHDDIGKLGKELAMLLWHKVPNHPPCLLIDFVCHPQAGLNGNLTGVEGRFRIRPARRCHGLMLPDRKPERKLWAQQKSSSGLLSRVWPELYHVRVWQKVPYECLLGW